MASSSLLNLTVPLGANGQSPSSQGLLMPKLAYRYRVFFNNFGIGAPPSTELTKQVMKFDRPHVQFEEIKLPIYNSTIKIAGKHSWSDITCDIRDDAAGNVSRLVGQQLQKQLDFLEQSSAPAANNYKFVTQLQVLDGGNGLNQERILENWVIEGCYLKDVNYNSMDYAQSEAVKITLSITYDNAFQTFAGSEQPIGVGENLGTVSPSNNPGSLATAPAIG
jgi:hypothetical protein